MLPSAKGSFFYFMLSQFTYFFLSYKQTLVSTMCIDSYILAYLHSSYYFVLTIIHEIYMLKLKANAETYIFLCVASKLSTKNLLLYELTPMQVLLMLVLKVLFMKSLCYMISCLVIVFTIASNHFIHFICFTIVLIKIMIAACHFRNYPYYRLPTRGRVGTKLGDA